jgi:hypothetical protein
MFIFERNNKGLSVDPEGTNSDGYIIPGAGSIILKNRKVQESAILGEIVGAAGAFVAWAKMTV